MNVAYGGTSGLLCPKYNKQKVKYSTEATVVRLVGSIQAMEMQAGYWNLQLTFAK